jgi:hypothetical protein
MDHDCLSSMILLEVNAAGITVLEFKRDAPRPIHMDRIARGFEASQSMKIKRRASRPSERHSGNCCFADFLSQARLTLAGNVSAMEHLLSVTPGVRVHGQKEGSGEEQGQAGSTLFRGPMATWMADRKRVHSRHDMQPCPRSGRLRHNDPAP